MLINNNYIEIVDRRENVAAYILYFILDSRSVSKMLRKKTVFTTDYRQLLRAGRKVIEDMPGKNDLHLHKVESNLVVLNTSGCTVKD